MATALFFAAILLLPLLPIILFLLSNGRSRSSKRLPRGSLGIPFVGQTLGFLRAMRNNTAEEWLRRRIDKYGPVSTLSLMGKPTVFLTGPAANKFVFTSEAVGLQQPQSATRMLGSRGLLFTVGDEHRRVRGAVAQFLKPEVLKKYVGQIDEEVRHHFRMNWIDRQFVTVMPLMKSLTFDVMSSLIVGLQGGALRENLVKDFNEMMAGMWAVPVNLPFTKFNKSLKARARTQKVLLKIIREKRTALEQGHCFPHEDLIAYLLSIGNPDKANYLSEEEILDNAILVLFAGYDTTSILLTLMIRHLANDPVTYAGILQEHEEIAKGKSEGEALCWDDLIKMKYTWRVALEMLRMIPPVFGNFRTALQDIEFEGYLIPKGWQVFWVASTTHMDAQIFEEPCKFDPSRFENQSSIPRNCFVAFGGGPHICPGNEFARIEVLITMHYLVTRFKWRLCCKDDVFSRDPMPSPNMGLPIQLEHKREL